MRADSGLQMATDYCPLDLFSGRRERIQHAIRSLWQGWVASDASANNLKIFASGKFIKPQDVSLTFSSAMCIRGYLKYRRLKLYLLMVATPSRTWTQ